MKPHPWYSIDCVLERISEGDIDYFVPGLPEELPGEELSLLLTRQIGLVATTMQTVAQALTDLHADEPGATIPEIVESLRARATELAPASAVDYRPFSEDDDEDD